MVFFKKIHDLVPRDRDPFGYRIIKSGPQEKSEGEPAFVSVVTLSTYVQKPLLNLNACAHIQT